MKYLYGPNAIQKGRITIHNHDPIFDQNFETIERKGKGHPDTVADALAERISRNYSKYTIEHCEGMILHHQVDKLMVVGGKTKVYFGGGEFVEPISVYIVGRASYKFANKKIPVTSIVRLSVKEYFKENFPLINFSKDVVIHNLLEDKPSPGSLTTSSGAMSKHMFTPLHSGQVRGYEKYVSNDTSCCVAYYPPSDLEAAILEVEGYLNGAEGKNEFPWLGSDIKIMAVRDYNEVSITACVPQISNYVGCMNDYWDNLEVISKCMLIKFQTLLPKYNVNLSLNTKDDYEKHTVYMTYTESSLSGEVGIVGRGNRTNGLITSNRPMSLEGTNGKNPRYYAGFIYANLSKIISKKIWDKFSEESVVEIVSQNGADLLDPWRTRVVTKADPKKTEELIRAEFTKIPDITNQFIENKIGKNY